jgi:sugar phosphate isomerase/epimerase
MSLMWGWDLPARKLGDWLADVKRAGYDGVATFENELFRLADDPSLQKQMDDLALPLASVDWFISRDFDRLKRVCEVMQSMNCRHLVALCGLAKKGADPQEIADLLSEAGELALSYGVWACYHNHTNDTGETLEQAEDLVGRTNPATFFGFLDVGHATKDFAGHPIEKRAAIFLERNWPRIRFIEFKDWSEQHDLNTEVGAGRCDYASVFRIMRDNGYSGWITVEQNGPMGDKTPLACAAASREFIRKGLGV